MEYLILIPLKKNYDVDLVKHLKVTINSQYGNVDEKTKENLETLNRMREKISSKNVDPRQEQSLESLQKYYDQIVLLNQKLLQADCPFKWKDAFEKPGYLFSTGTLTVNNLGFEKVCVLFNIGALQTSLGAFHSKEASFNDNSLKQAIKYFQAAAGIFQALKHTSCSSAQTNEVTFDLQSDVLNLLHHIMLAQAQETFFFKASSDKMKEQSIARVAAQCEELYNEVYKQIQAINYKEKTHLAEWIDIFVMKQNAYRAIAEYYQAIAAQQKKEFGEQIARLTQASEFFKLAETKVTIGLASKFKELQNKTNQLLEEAKRDNDFIYHAKIPAHKSLPIIQKAALAKATDPPTLYFPGESDFFKNLLPFGMHQSIQKLESRKQELVNSEIGTLREQTQTLNAVLASLNLPAALEDVKGVEVPKSIQEKASSVQEKGGIKEIERLFNELPDLLQRNKEILDEIERSLNAEEESDKSLKAQFKERWTRTPSANLNQTWRDHIVKYRLIIQKAVEADNKLKTSYNSNIEKIRLLSNSPDALASAIPSGNNDVSKFDDTVVRELKNLLSQVENFKKERETLENELKNIEFEELKTKFLNSLNLHPGVDESSLSAETMGEFFGNIQKKVRESNDKQEKLLDQIRVANEKFVAQRGTNGVNKRDQFMKDLASAYEIYMQLLSNLKEGTKFYNDLTQLLVNLQVKVNDFSFARKAEREELCKDLQNEIVKRPNEPVPNAPTYQTSEPTVTATQTNISATPAQAPYPQASYPAQPMGYPGTFQASPYNYYPPPPLPQGFNPYAMPQMSPYYPQSSYYPPPGAHPPQ